MTTIAARLDAVRARIAAAARHAGRDPADVKLLAVSKTWPAEAVREAAAAERPDGRRVLGDADGRRAGWHAGTSVWPFGAAHRRSRWKHQMAMKHATHSGDRNTSDSSP